MDGFSKGQSICFVNFTEGQHSFLKSFPIIILKIQFKFTEERKTLMKEGLSWADRLWVCCSDQRSPSLQLHLMTEGLKRTLRSHTSSCCSTKKRLLTEVPEGSRAGRWFRQTEREAEDQTPLRMKQQMADEEAAWHALTVEKSKFFRSFTQCMHKQAVQKSLYSSIHEQAGAETQDYRLSGQSVHGD